MPAQSHLAQARLNGRILGWRRMRLAGKQLDPHVEAVEIIGGEGSFQHTAKLTIVTHRFQLLRRPPDRKIVDEDLALLQSALRHPAQFSQLQITQTLYADPDSDSQNRKNQSQRASGRPKQEQA